MQLPLESVPNFSEGRDGGTIEIASDSLYGFRKPSSRTNVWRYGTALTLEI